MMLCEIFFPNLGLERVEWGGRSGERGRRVRVKERRRGERDAEKDMREREIGIIYERRERGEFFFFSNIKDWIFYTTFSKITPD